jgi:hypothetical protein
MYAAFTVVEYMAMLESRRMMTVASTVKRLSHRKPSNACSNFFVLCPKAPKMRDDHVDGVPFLYFTRKHIIVTRQ